MIKKICRINGNQNYSYAKVYLALIGDDIYVDSYEYGKYGCFDALFKLNKEYVMHQRAEELDDIAELLNIIRPRTEFDNEYNEFCNVNYYVKQAMRVCDITREDQLNVGGIKGLSITNW